MQVWPLLIIFDQTIRETAFFISADSSIIVGDFPPSSNVVEARCWAAFSIILLPVPADPVKKIWLNGRSKSAAPRAPSPVNTIASFGSKVDSIMLLNSSLQQGLRSDGFMITVLPAARAAT